MALNEFLRDLHLTSPNMKGSDVSILQKKLGRIHKIDGVYGPITAAAVKDWKWRIGLPDKQVNTTLTRDESEYFFGKKRSIIMQTRTKSRLKGAAQALSSREKAVSLMENWAANRYHETRTNFVPELSELGARQKIKPYYYNMGYSWCAYAVNLSGMVFGMQSAKDGFNGKYNALYCPDILAQARARRYGWMVIDWSQARRGDVVLFDWDDDGIADHIGLLRDNNNGVGISLVDTVEGNTSAGAGGSQSNGDGVYNRVRNKSDIIAVVRRS
jgi:hypothetical protein